MVGYVAADSDLVFDPAFGAGAFASAGRRLSATLGRTIRFAGCELDPAALREAREAGIPARELRRVRIGDFLALKALPKGARIVANPPYIRHHRLGPALKARLQRIAIENVGVALDGRTGLHVFFLIHALSLLEKGRSVAFIVPADVCEGVYARALWQWIGSRFRLDAVVTFSADATPFPGVDTNPIVLMIRKLPPSETFLWARIERAGGEDFLSWVRRGLPECSTGAMRAEQRSVRVGLSAGVSRRVQMAEAPEFRLGDFARVMRGVATGANEFFLLTSEKAREVGIPPELLVRAIGRTRDVPGDCVDESLLDELDRAGRPTYLLALDGKREEAFPPSVRRYLARGVQLGLPERPLIAQRRPWYKMERRVAPRFLFSYLGRRNSRFIRNDAGVWPLTGFLCVYPRSSAPDTVRALEELLNHPDVLRGLETVAKSYGSGALKVEPRALERLPIPRRLVDDVGLEVTLASDPAAAEADQMALAI